MGILLKESDVAVIPTKSEVVAPVMWINQILIRCPGPDHEGSVVMEYVPMSDRAECAYSKHAHFSLFFVVSHTYLHEYCVF